MPLTIIVAMPVQTASGEQQVKFQIAVHSQPQKLESKKKIAYPSSRRKGKQ